MALIHQFSDKRFKLLHLERLGDKVGHARGNGLCDDSTVGTGGHRNNGQLQRDDATDRGDLVAVMLVLMMMMVMMMVRLGDRRDGRRCGVRCGRRERRR